MPEIFVKPKSKITKPQSMHLFASFFEKPSNVTFQTQEKDEDVLLFLRKHFITNVPWIMTTLLLLVLPAFLSFLISIGNVSLSFIPTRFMFVFGLFYYLVIFSYVFASFITWFYNVFIVTQKRVIDIDYSHLVYHNIAVTKIGLIEDVNYTQSGFIRSLFNYGDLFLATASEVLNFEALAIPKPRDAVRIIGEIIGGKGHDV